MDAAPDIPAFRKMLEGIGFNISAATMIYNLEGINQFSKLKALSDDWQGIRQGKHRIAVVHKLSGGHDVHVINARD